MSRQSHAAAYQYGASARASTVHGSYGHGQGSRASMMPSSSSTAANHQQHALQFDAHGNVLLTAAQQRVRDKQAEWDGFIKVLRQTEQLDDYLKQMADKTLLLQDGGAAMARIVENWQNVFRATHIALSGMAARQAAGEADPPVPVLVRVPVDGSLVPHDGREDEDATST